MAQNQKKNEKKPKIKAGKQKGITAGFSYEYVTDLEDINTRIEQFNIMRRSDSQVGGILRAIKLPIMKAQWSITEGKQEIRDFIDYNLFTLMSTSFSDFMRWALTSLDFGFSAFEKVFDYNEIDRKIYWRKLLFLPQKTIYKIEAEEDGGLKRILQYPAEPAEMVANDNYIEIPVEYCLVFTLEREGDWYGTSVLRNAYGNWKVKDSLVKIDAIKHDRYGVGVPYMKLSPNYNDEDMLIAKNTLSKMRSHEYSYMIIPPNVEDFGILELAGNGNIDTIGSIRYHDESIAKSVLAQFIDLGTSNSGNRALGQSFIQLFLMSLNSLADFIGEVFTKYAIKQLVDYNYGQQDEYPKLTHAKIDIYDIMEGLKILNDLYKNGVISLSPEDENIIREHIGLPPKAEEQQPAKKAEQQKKPTKVADNETKTMHEHINHLEFDERGNPITFRELAPIEKTINWREYTETLDNLESQFITDMKKYRDKQIKSLVYDLVNLGKPIDKIKLRYADMYKKIIQDYQEKAFKIGYEQVKKEKEKTFLERGVETINLYEFQNIPNDVLELMGINAQIGAEVLSSRTKAFIVNQYVMYKNEGLPNKDIANRLYSNTLGKGNKVIKEEFDRVSNMWGKGRAQYGMDDKEVKGAYYSAVLDGKACDVCMNADTQYNAYHDKPFSIEYLSEVAPAPNPDCRGGAACRCIWVYEYFVERGEGVEGFPDDFPKGFKKKEPKNVSLIDRIKGAKSVKDIEYALTESLNTRSISLKGADLDIGKQIAEALYNLREAKGGVKFDYIGTRTGLTEIKKVMINYYSMSEENAEEMVKYLKKLAKQNNDALAFYWTMPIDRPGGGIGRFNIMVFNDKEFYSPQMWNLYKKDLDVFNGFQTATHEYIHSLDAKTLWKMGKEFRKEYNDALFEGYGIGKGKEIDGKPLYRVVALRLEKLIGPHYLDNEAEELAELISGRLTGIIDEKLITKDLTDVIDKYIDKMGLTEIRAKLTEANKRIVKNVLGKEIDEIRDGIIEDVKKMLGDIKE